MFYDGQVAFVTLLVVVCGDRTVAKAAGVGTGVLHVGRAHRSAFSKDPARLRFQRRWTCPRPRPAPTPGRQTPQGFGGSWAFSVPLQGHTCSSGVQGGGERSFLARTEAQPAQWAVETPEYRQVGNTQKDQGELLALFQLSETTAEWQQNPQKLWRPRIN